MAETPFKPISVASKNDVPDANEEHKGKVYFCEDGALYWFNDSGEKVELLKPSSERASEVNGIRQSITQNTQNITGNDVDIQNLTLRISALEESTGGGEIVESSDDGVIDEYDPDHEYQIGQACMYSGLMFIRRTSPGNSVPTEDPENWFCPRGTYKVTVANYEKIQFERYDGEQLDWKGVSNSYESVSLMAVTNNTYMGVLEAMSATINLNIYRDPNAATLTPFCHRIGYNANGMDLYAEFSAVDEEPATIYFKAFGDGVQESALDGTMLITLNPRRGELPNSSVVLAGNLQEGTAEETLFPSDAEFATLGAGTRQQAGCNAGKNKFFMYGGVDRNGNTTSKAHIYDAVKGEWTTCQAMNSPYAARYSAAEHVEEGKILVYGGYSSATNKYEIQKQQKIYNIDSNTWEDANLPIDKNADRPFIVELKNGKFIVGNTQNNEFAYLFDGLNDANPVELTKLITWLDTYNVRAEDMCAIAPGILFMHDETKPAIYNTDTDTITELPLENKHKPFVCAACEYLSPGKVLLFGGIDYNDKDDATIFNLNNGTWSEAIVPLSARQNSCSALLQEGVVVIVGGRNAQTYENFEDSTIFYESGKHLDQIMDGSTPANTTAINKLAKRGEDITRCDISQITDMTGMFQDVVDFNQDISGWDVGHVTNFSQTFHGCHSFNQDLSGWNVSKGENFFRMFSHCKVFNQPLNGWDMSSAADIGFMFSDAWEFNQPLDTWQTGNVTNMECTFLRAKKFSQDISMWNVSKVTNHGYFDLTSGLTAGQKPTFP